MIQQSIENKLQHAFTPRVLEVVNESFMHNVPPGSQSHFKVIVVSDDFEGQRLIQRHRAINQILNEELTQHIHALAIHAYTWDEWQEQCTQVQESPMCLGGSGK